MVKVDSISFKKYGVVIHSVINGIQAWPVASDFAKIIEGSVEFKVSWMDGESYEGTANILKGKGYDFAAHIRTYCETYTGKYKPTHLTPEQYKAGMAQVPKATAAKLAKLLKDYDLTETPQVNDDPLKDNIVNLREWRFKNIKEGTFKGFEPDRSTLFDDDFFPAAPVDPDNYEVPLTGAVYNFKLPQGRA